MDLKRREVCKRGTKTSFFFFLFFQKSWRPISKRVLLTGAVQHPLRRNLIKIFLNEETFMEEREAIKFFIYKTKIPYFIF